MTDLLDRPTTLADPDQDRGAPHAGRVAYLVNVYPKVSHSFIRTEISALEDLGLRVERFTIRRSREDAPDSEDQAEAARTTALLDGNLAGLLRAVATRLVKAPKATLRGLMQALRRRGAGGMSRAFAYFAEAAALCHALERQGIRHLHVHFGTNPAAVARLAAAMGDLSYSFTVHGPDEFDAPRELDLAGKVADAAFVVAVSSYGRAQLMRWSDPAHWPKIWLVRCAVSPRFLDPGQAPDEGLHARRFTCVARLSAQKGIPLLLEAAAALGRTRRFELDIIGGGEDEAWTERRIGELGLGDTVRLLGWRCADDVRRSILASRAFVLPSFAEGLPVVLMEALALERPVIATAIAGIPELVGPDTGWLIPSGSVEALGDAMVAALAADPEDLRAMGQAGRARVLAAHHPRLNAERLAGLLSAHL